MSLKNRMGKREHELPEPLVDITDCGSIFVCLSCSTLYHSCLRQYFAHSRYFICSVEGRMGGFRVQSTDGWEALPMSATQQ